MTWGQARAACQPLPQAEPGTLCTTLQLAIKAAQEGSPAAEDWRNKVDGFRRMLALCYDLLRDEEQVDLGGGAVTTRGDRFRQRLELVSGNLSGWLW